jgi:hypothetical protein
MRSHLKLEQIKPASELAAFQLYDLALAVVDLLYLPARSYQQLKLFNPLELMHMGYHISS